MSLAKKIVLICFIAALAAAGFFAYKKYEYMKLYELSPGREIRFTDKGFAPDRLVVNLGDAVEFENASQKPFWPASNLHPSHLVYPDFDPRRPIQASSSWTFAFNKPGVWKFHDHLASDFTGEIVVLSKGGKVVEPTCKSKTDTPAACYEEDVVRELKKDGLDAALDRMSYLYDTDPAFRDSCHAVSHVLGKNAYHLFEEGKQVNLSAKTSYCSYGFYHGFMEEMLQLSGSADEAREFCSSAAKAVSKESANAEGACFHGIGHGAADGSDPRAWGDPVALTDPGVALCDAVDPTEPHFYRCSSGVFNSLAIMYINNSYNLRMDDTAADPFAVCKNWKEYRIKNPCYQEMNSLVMKHSKGDLAAGIKIVEKIQDDPKYAALAMTSFAAFIPASFTVPFDAGFDKTIDACHAARADLVGPCLNGIPSGIMEFGTPGREYQQALKFCSSKKLSSSEREACFTVAFGGMRSYYPDEKVTSICKSAEVPEDRRADCLKR